MKKEDSGLAGILVVDKPEGFTSFDVVAKLRGICGTRRIGHGGTLDPMATGVLPVFLGGAAKAVDLQPKQDKTYEASFLFGLGTDTGDITGAVLQQSDASITRQMLETALAGFCGTITQLPPMYSAVKVNGKPLYKYAREGKAVERKTRQVTIHEAAVLAEEGPNRFLARVHCSKGTYIRTLCEDIGTKLGVPATLAALRRTTAGAFDLGMAYTLQEIQAAKDENRLESLLLNVGCVFGSLPRIEVGGEALRRLQNGATVYGIKQPQGRYAAYDEAGRFLGLVQMHEEGTLHVDKFF